MKKIAKAALLISSALLLAAGLVAARIYSYRDARSDAPADAAVVLGAAVWGKEVSPSFGSASTTGSTSTAGAESGS